MKRPVFWGAILLCLLLAGCNWAEGNFHSATLHQEHIQNGDISDVSAANAQELCTALENMIAIGQEKAIVYVTEYDPDKVSTGIRNAVRNTLQNYPLAAYAVEDIAYELGTSGGKSAIALEITYIHNRAEIQRIQKTADMEQAKEAIFTALTECDSGLVLWTENYVQLDFDQLVQDYSQTWPQYIMETPQLVANIYPETGSSRILELKFSYENSREDLRAMESYVNSIFKAAGLYVSSEDTDGVKLNQLYGFLMERFDYQVDTSITPAYSLLRHGVGNSKAFATVFAAMCRQAGLECLVVTGTCNGEPRYWNIVLDAETYYHVDLLKSAELGKLQKLTDGAMGGYVWDYSAYPVCPDPEITIEPPDDSTPDDPTEETTEPEESSTPSEAETEDPSESTAPSGEDGATDAA